MAFSVAALVAEVSSAEPVSASAFFGAGLLPAAFLPPAAPSPRTAPSPPGLSPTRPSSSAVLSGRGRLDGGRGVTIEASWAG
ncbi:MULTISPECIES: hypothetical protein [unclassified Streptomyces]|uniref:hypothetical protein n=1 Tax=unclassified Streptomyces TaxID=2593676 RepID=UPI0037F35EA1